MESSPTVETLLVRPLLVGSLCSAILILMHARGICACAVAHNAMPQRKKAYYAGIMLDALKGLLCSKLCRHNICMPNSKANKCAVWHLRFAFVY